MDNIDYSVIIRTTGNANEKYQKLLDSIAGLIPQPKEIIVVLPEGYGLPEQRLGSETFLFCTKGMVRQRLKGIEACKTEYALVCDDDVSFPADFVRKLHEPIKKGLGSFSIAPLYSFLPDNGINSLICMVMASAVPTVIYRKTRYISVLKSTGYSYNRHLDRSHTHYYETQSAAWTCFYTNVGTMRALEMEKEIWLDSHGYSAMDDQTMFYKAWLMGLKTIVVSDAVYEHMDAKTSIQGNRSAVIYARSFNRVVFWHRFIYTQQHRWWGFILSIIAFRYRLFWAGIRSRSSLLRKKMTWEEYLLQKNGIKDAYRYIQSEEYIQLPELIIE